MLLTLSLAIKAVAYECLSGFMQASAICAADFVKVVGYQAFCSIDKFLKRVNYILAPEAG